MATEKRLIEVKSAWEKAQRIYSDPVLLHVIKNVLDETPTIDAVEVVHGRWIYEEKPDDNNNVQAHCSVCLAGDLHATALMNKVPYCWKCGAKMDGDGNGNAD